MAGMTINSKQRKHVHVFCEKLFLEKRYCKELFRKLCAEGCSEASLADLLFAVCVMADKVPDRLIDSDISSADLKRLVRDLQSTADLVRRVNKTPLHPKKHFLWMSPDPNRDPERQYASRMYDILPGIMRVYALHLERFSMFLSARLKRLTYGQIATLQLLLYVERSTGGPRYEDASNLLTAGFVAAGGTENNIPKYFTADALAKLMQRTKKLGLISYF